MFQAELINLRTELVDARACRDLVLQRNAIKSHKGTHPIFQVTICKWILDTFMTIVFNSGLLDSGIGESIRFRGECNQLYRENEALRDTVLALHSEVYGAR